jgi:hypothetical protein
LARWTSRRARFALVVPTTLALLAPTAAVAQGTHDPSEAAGGWLASQLVDDERIEVTFDFGDGPQTFDDYGLTADVVFALAGAGVAAGHIESATDWLEDETGAYTGVDWGDVYAGAVAKLLVVAATTDRGPDDFGGEDLVALLEDREQDSGRFTDDTDGDFSSVITQSLAVIGLERAADTTPSDTAVDYLAAQACDEGGFPQALDADECVPQVDATGFAVQALLSVGETAAAADAVSWLLDQQEDDGGFVGDEGTANANSTGLATIALLEAGEDDAAVLGQEFLLTLQAGCDDPDTASIRYDAADGGDRVRATAQALPALSGFGLASVSAEGAMDALPSFDCPFPDVDEDNVHYTAIHDLRARGIISGRADGTFGPAASVTRGQMAAIVARAAELDPVDPDDADERFTDVDGHTHEGAIYALAEAEVVAGYGDGTFRPNVAVQRDQAASLLARWLGLAPLDEDQFTDIEGNVHREQINALAEIEVAFGTEDGEYLPGRSIRRDQTASLVLRALEYTEAGEDDTSTAAAR